jgi:hypothetical protein
MSKQRAYKLAAELGCEITHEEGDRILLDAIPPMKLSSQGDHCRVYPIEDGIKCQTTRRTAWQEIIEDLKDGIELCDIERCDMCAEAGL